MTEALVHAEDLAADLLCGHCSHNLRGIDSHRCPECGKPFDPTRLLSTAIPWENRRGTRKPVRALLATIWVISFHPMRLIDDDAPVTLSAAREYRVFVVVILYVMCAIPAGFAVFSKYNAPDIMKEALFWTAAAALPLSLAALTGMASLFFAPKRLPPAEQSRAVAVSLYLSTLFIGAGPLTALGILSGLSTHNGIHSIGPGPSNASLFFFLLSATLPIAWLLATWIIPCRILYRLTHSRLRVAVFALLWPIACLIALVAPFVILSTLITYFVVLRATW